MDSGRRACYQINLQLSLGGGEIYTRFLTTALRELGYDTVLFVHPEARFWPQFIGSAATLVPVRTLAEIEAKIPGAGALVLTHSVLPPEAALSFAARTRLAGLLHMPLYERLPGGLRYYHRLFAVSEHVIASARASGLANVHPVPLYGVADVAPRAAAVAAAGAAANAIHAGRIYDWDRRKMRDRLLGWLEAAGLMQGRSATAKVFQRRPGLTLGIVSRMTPIKQFPQMFSILSPVIARFPRINLEIFGAGGFASVRDLRRALAPVRGQVRWWGQQDDVAAIYPQLDYVLSGLPEKEALGLNLIEAQYCNTPVLAVRAPPFTESVADGETGFLYADPRQDQGQGFAALLEKLLAGQPRPEPRLAVAHLARFSEANFRERLAGALADMTGPLEPAGS